MKKILFIVLLSPAFLFAQVGIGTTNPNSSLDVRSSNQATPTNTDGLLIPKIDEFPGTNPNGGQTGMLVYVTGTGTPTRGFYYWVDGISAWVPIQSIERINDLLDGKSDFDGSNNGSSIFLGISAGASDDSSNNKNIGIGFQSLSNVVGADANDPEGQNNVAVGYQSLSSNTSGRQNIAIGSFTLDANTSGFNNTAVGHNALAANDDGVRNTAIGQSTLVANTSGNNNIAIGGQTLTANTSGSSNVAVGAFTLTSNTIGLNNVAMGNQGLRFNVFGSSNVAIGDYAGRALDDENISDINNDRNVYIGSNAGNSDLDASNNVYIGHEAGAGDYNPEDNTGTAENKSGNVFIGYQAGFNESNSDRLYIANSNANQNNALIFGNFGNGKLRINNSLGIGRGAATNALEIEGDASKTTAGSFIANSDRRLKANINTINGQTALERLSKLRGVTYEWNDNKTGINRPTSIQYGFIAQELMEVFPEKVTKDALGYYQTAYGDYDAFFVEAIKELHTEVESLKSENEDLKKALNQLHVFEARLQALESSETQNNKTTVLLSKK